jgi:hypothetical protein
MYFPVERYLYMKIEGHENVSAVNYFFDSFCDIGSLFTNYPQQAGGNSDK